MAALIVTYFLSSYSERSPGFLVALFQGTGTELQGYRIHTGFKYLYHHHEYLGGVSVSKVSKNYMGIENGYYLKFNEGAKKEVDEINKLCNRDVSHCETISFEGYTGITLSTYIESQDEIINKTIYFNSFCEVYASHIGNPFDSRYIEVIERFFSDNCNHANS